MAQLDELLKQLEEQEDAGDAEGMWKTREAIVTQHPDAEQAVEAQYKAGLHYLFHIRNIETAVEHFQAAAKEEAPYWSLAARTSLGICLFHQGRGQKALLN